MPYQRGGHLLAFSLGSDWGTAKQNLYTVKLTEKPLGGIDRPVGFCDTSADDKGASLSKPKGSPPPGDFFLKFR